jgi:hypothetical protein
MVNVGNLTCLIRYEIGVFKGPAASHHGTTMKSPLLATAFLLASISLFGAAASNGTIPGVPPTVPPTVPPVVKPACPKESSKKPETKKEVPHKQQPKQVEKKEESKKWPVKRS